jgi:DNA-binding protein H-NS
MKNHVVLLAILSFSIACSKIEKAEKNMTTMKTQTEKMSLTTDNMKEVTQNMYEQIRSKDTRALRLAEYQVITAEDAEMGERLASAAVFFQAMEFQVWTGEGNDNQEAREKLYLSATKEFVKYLNDIYKGINLKRMSPLKERKKHSSEKAFYALAAAMHYNHAYQEKLAQDNPQIKLTSFYDLIKVALAKFNDGEALLPHEEVLTTQINRTILIELIKARVDILSALALKNLTNKDEMTVTQKFKAIYFKVTGGKFGSIDIPETYKTTETSTNNETITYLDAAKKARNFLERIGVNKELEKTLHSALGNVDLKNAIKVSGNSDAEQTQNEVKVDKVREKIRQLIDDLYI